MQKQFRILGVLVGLLTSFLGLSQYNSYNHSATTVSDTTGILYDNGGPNNPYNANTIETAFVIKPSNGKEVNTRFVQFDVETNEGGVQQGCIYDYVEIYEGEGADPLNLVGRYCGTNTPPDYTSTTGAVTILFYSDGGTERSGYKMFWSTDGNFPAAPTTYCDAAGLPCAQAPNRIINRVQLGAIDNSSACSATGYSDYFDQIAEVQQSGEETITVTVNGFGNPFHYMAAWVDWNQDGAFEATEKTEIAGNGMAADEFTGVIVVPGDALEGLTRMRIRYTTGLGNLEPCGTDSDGEVEDYGIIVGTRIPCVTQTLPADGDSALCVNATTLEWNSVAEASAYDFSLRYWDGTAWVMVEDNLSTTDTSYTLAGDLELNTHYVWIAVPVDGSNRGVLCDSLEFYSAGEGLPSLEIPINNRGVCVDTEVELEALASGGKPGYTFAWSGDSEYLDRIDSSHVIFSSSLVGDFELKVVVNDANGCASDTAIGLLETLAGPSSLALWPDTAICPGTDVEMLLYTDANYIEFQVNDGGWSNVNYIQMDDTTFQVDLAQAFTEIRLLAQLNGCSDSSIIQEFTHIMAPEAPSIVSSDLDLQWCSGESNFLFIDNYDDLITWNTGVENDTLDITESGSYFAQYAYENGKCVISSDTLDVQVDFIPSMTLIDAAGNGFCPNDSVLLSITTPFDVVWSDGFMGDSNYVDVAGEYSAELRSSAGCVGYTDTLIIAAFNGPEKPEITRDENIPVCEGNTIELTTNSTENLEWSNGETSSNISVTASGVYTVTATNNLGCSSTSDPLELIFAAKPLQPEILQIASDTLLSSISATRYLWFLDGNPVGTDSIAIFVTDQGDYTLIVESFVGCPSDPSEAYFYDPNSMGEHEKSTNLMAYPNPLMKGGSLTVEVKRDAFYTLTTLDGRVVEKLFLREGIQKLEASWPVGVYVLQSMTNSNEHVRIIIK